MHSLASPSPHLHRLTHRQRAAFVKFSFDAKARKKEHVTITCLPLGINSWRSDRKLPLKILSSQLMDPGHPSEDLRWCVIRDSQRSTQLFQEHMQIYWMRSVQFHLVPHLQAVNVTTLFRPGLFKWSPRKGWILAFAHETWIVSIVNFERWARIFG